MKKTPKEMGAQAPFLTPKIITTDHALDRIMTRLGLTENNFYALYHASTKRMLSDGEISRNSQLSKSCHSSDVMLIEGMNVYLLGTLVNKDKHLQVATVIKSKNKQK